MRKMPNKIINDQYDAVAERTVLSGILTNGRSFFIDVLHNTVHDTDFFLPENKLLYSAISDLIIKEDIEFPSVVSVLAKISTVDKSAINKFELTDYITALSQDVVSKEDCGPSVKRISRLGLTRQLIAKLQGGIDVLKTTDGSQPITELIQLAEQPLATFTNELLNVDGCVNLSEEIGPYIEYMATEQPSLPGYPTGFSIYDECLGGGLRYPGVHLIGGRAKSGKTFVLLNIANNITAQDIPVLYLDTELTKNDVLARWSAMITDVPTNQIETGQFAKSMSLAQEVSTKIKTVENKRQFYYENISGKHYLDWISIMRRWLLRKVGFNAEGKANPCVIVLDYIKLMNLDHIKNNFAEHQYLGQTITDLHNFAVQYNLPILAGAQLNRDGISREDQGVIAGSDKLIGLCASFAIWKNKTPEDLAADPISNGNKKMLFAACRYGPGTEEGEYINYKCDFSKAKILEGETNITNRVGSRPKLKAKSDLVVQKGTVTDEAPFTTEDNGTDADEYINI
jgi:replicative DNA helicase